jgi:hypothetical protein
MKAQQHDEDEPHKPVRLRRHGGAVAEVGALRQHVEHGGGRRCRQQVVPPADAVAEPPGHGKHQEAERQHHADVRRPQHVRRHDLVGGIEVEQRHRHRERGDGQADPAREAVERTLLRLDVALQLLLSVPTERCGRLRRDGLGLERAGFHAVLPPGRDLWRSLAPRYRAMLHERARAGHPAMRRMPKRRVVEVSDPLWVSHHSASRIGAMVSDPEV